MYATDLDELHDKSVPSLKPYGSWNRVAAWLPWMLMGQSEGHLFYRSHTLKLNGSTIGDATLPNIVKVMPNLEHVELCNCE